MPSHRPRVRALSAREAAPDRTAEPAAASTVSHAVPQPAVTNRMLARLLEADGSGAAALTAGPAGAAGPLGAAGSNRLLARLLDQDHAGHDHGDDHDGHHHDHASGVASRIRDRIGGGSPMPAEVRAEAEAGLGASLGHVRLHTDGHAARLASDVGAHAFTVGSDVFFNTGQYDPASTGGYSVLMHELAHTMQQSSGPVAGREVAPGLSVSHPGDRDEVAARSVADRLTAARGTALHDGHDHPAPPVSVNRTASGVGAGTMALQRHSSWEHTLLGDTAPSQLGEATVSAKARGHVLSDLWARMMFFSEDPGRDPRGRFPDVRWVQLRGSQLWVSNGELNALADYLPDPAAVDTLTREEMVPVLQKMRSGIRGAAGANFGLRGTEMAGMATHWMEYVSQAGGEVKALDEATADLGTNRYAGLLSRNACHFAPMSWHRWALYHEQAAEEARAHFATREDAVPLKDVPLETAEHARQAIIVNGYADHFLEDSFASGHLVNKTLVMQWWVDYLNARTIEFAGLRIGRRGQPDADVMARMGTGVQTGVSGRHLYGRTPGTSSSSPDDRLSGRDAIDPQTAQERLDHEGRVAGSGVTGANAAEIEANYQAYLRLLNNAQAQGAAGATHDHFNALGLTVISADGTVQMRVGGDDTLISKSGPVGAAAAARAAQMSRQAIDEILDTGTTSLTPDVIFGSVPTQVLVDGRADPVPLEQWQDQILHDICWNEIFPDYYASLASAVIGAFGAEMVEGGMSVDIGR